MTTPAYRHGDRVTLHHGDCLDILRELPDNSVHAVVTDPPYGLANTTPTQVADTLVRWVNGDRDYLPGGAGFMGKAWDAFVPPVAVWDECLRVLKPGGHLLAFAGSRTQDLMGLAIRLAGFDVRDSIAWLYGSGFPKSLDVSKAVDKHLTPREAPDLTMEYRFTEWMRSTGVTSRQINAATDSQMGGHYLTPSSQPAVPTGAMLDLLRPLLPGVPAWVEDLVVQREAEKAEARARAEASRFLDTLGPQRGRPDSEHDTWQGWGTALKPAHEPIVVARKPLTGTVAANVLTHGTGALNVDACRVAHDGSGVWGDSQNADAHASALGYMGGEVGRVSSRNPSGRWPANVALDQSQAEVLDEQSGDRPGGHFPAKRSEGQQLYGGGKGLPIDTGHEPHSMGDSGGASRFFPTFHWQAKAPTDERPRAAGVAHPTVKPLDLMRWLVRLVTPPGGTVLEPFAGSGTTVEACLLEGFACIAIEREASYLPLIRERINRQTDPVAYHQGEAADDPDHDPGLFALLDGPAA